MNKIPRGQTPERRAYMKAWNAANPRDRSAYRAAYRAANAEREKAYREARRELHKAQNAAWYAANRERILARVKANSQANREHILAYQAEYYAEHTEKVKATVAAYRAANPEKKAHLENRRRARKANNGGSHTLEQRREKFELLGNVCMYCGEDKKLTVDHKIPLARGGTDCILNIVPACRSCNSKKNAKTAREFVFGRTNHQKIGGVGGLDQGR